MHRWSQIPWIGYLQLVVLLIKLLYHLVWMGLLATGEGYIYLVATTRVHNNTCTDVLPPVNHCMLLYNV